MRDLLVATNNAGKLAEFRRLLSGLPVRVVAPKEIGLELMVPEPHLAYAENARDKAVAFAGSSGLLSLADDSGIEVAALDWGPGARSARWGGTTSGDNANILLERMAGIADRRARMVCWLALADPGSAPSEVPLFTGTVEGAIATERRGGGGFGYDPIFELPSGLTTAELPPEEKDGLSHRGRAVAAAADTIRALAAGS
ncbi:MAG: non-canonical purine NTP pyrophosphatase [Chloroflexi bacterium]|nr:MAG: non-canonical purine NTP pyrophosphatase [Chloroflexota bacterium]